MATYTLTHTSTLQTTDCYACGVTFAMPTSLYNDRLEDHRSFWCPNGHEQHFVGKTAAQREREARQAAEAKAARVQAALDQQRAKNETLERSRSALKGEVTKARKRAARTQCPVADCRRMFAPTNMLAHVATEHPHWHPEPVLEQA